MTEGSRLDPTTTAHLAAIGKVAAYWSTFESTLDRLSHDLAGINSKVGMCLTAQISGTGRKLDAYIALARSRGTTKAIPELNKFANDTVGLAEQRNRIIHDSWIIVPAHPPLRLEITARKKPVADLIEHSTPEVEKLASAIVAHVKRLIDLHRQMLAEAGPLPEKPQ